MSKPFTWRAEALCSARAPNPTGQSGGKDNRIVFGSSLESTNNGRVMSQTNIRLCSKFRQQTTWQVRYDWSSSVYQSDVHVCGALSRLVLRRALKGIVQGLFGARCLAPGGLECIACRRSQRVEVLGAKRY